MMKKTGEKNAALSCLKFLFCSIIVVMHYGIPFRGTYWAEGGYIFVDFFFMLQGYFLIGNQVKQAGAASDAAWRYLRNRMRRFFPGVLVSALLMLAVFAPTIIGFRDVVKRAIAFFYQVTFLSQLMPDTMLEYGGILWFLSASLVAGTLFVFLYGLLKDNLYPVCVWVWAPAYHMIFQISGSMDVWRGSFHGVILAGTVRAAAGVALGMTLRQLSNYLCTQRFRRWVIHLSRACVPVIVACILWLVVELPHTMADLKNLTGFAALLLILTYPENIFHCRLADFLDRLCMPLYLFQVSSICLVNYLVTPRNQWGCMIAYALDLLIGIVWNRYSGKITIKRWLIEEPTRH